MGYRRTPFAPEEWYHCYSRGVDKRTVFEMSRDYDRFVEALYLSNSRTSLERGTFQRLSHGEILQLPRDGSLVAIGAYCLMPNHFHLLIKETQEGGITKFMHRLGTSYTMYFNISRKRVGNLFVKPFRSKHVSDDRYAQRVTQYINLNPVELFEPEWKTGKMRNKQSLQKKLREYRYSSFIDYAGEKRVEQSILDQEAMNLLGDNKILIENLLEETAAYYAELSDA